MTSSHQASAELNSLRASVAQSRSLSWFGMPRALAAPAPARRQRSFFEELAFAWAWHAGQGNGAHADNERMSALRLMFEAAFCELCTPTLPLAPPQAYHARGRAGCRGTVAYLGYVTFRCLTLILNYHL